MCFDYFYVDVTTGVDDYEKVNYDDDAAADDGDDDVVEVIIA